MANHEPGWRPGPASKEESPRREIIPSQRERREFGDALADLSDKARELGQMVELPPEIRRAVATFILDYAENRAHLVNPENSGRRDVLEAGLDEDAVEDIARGVGAQMGNMIRKALGVSDEEWTTLIRELGDLGGDD